MHAILPLVRIGFSPGEFPDFVLGWLGADIAGDDRPAAPPTAPAPCEKLPRDPLPPEAGHARGTTH